MVRLKPAIRRDLSAQRTSSTGSTNQRRLSRFAQPSRTEEPGKTRVLTSICTFSCTLLKLFNFGGQPEAGRVYQQRLEFTWHLASQAVCKTDSFHRPFRGNHAVVQRSLGGHCLIRRSIDRTHFCGVGRLKAQVSTESLSVPIAV